MSDVFLQRLHTAASVACFHRHDTQPPAMFGADLSGQRLCSRDLLRSDHDAEPC
jgi:hypothetical protein